jgi:DNA polymerase II small subunit
MLDDLLQNGIRLTIDAEEFIKTIPKEKDNLLLTSIINLKKPLIAKADIEQLIPKVEIVRSTNFLPLAKEYSANIKVNESRDVTGKSRTKGEVENFINHFRDRYERLSRLLKRPGASAIGLEDAKKQIGEKVRVIVFVTEKRETKKGNVLLQLEDMTGTFMAIVSSNKKDEKIGEKIKGILIDEVISITGKVLEPYIIVEDIEWPDMPVIRERREVENDLATVYLSDLHFGSKYFMGKNLNLFVDWIHGKGEAKELAGKVKYIVIAGDVADGIGVYPNQEKELAVKDIYQQYKMFDEFVEKIPDHIEIIVGPGNHDAVRRGEPQPAMGKDLFSADVIRIGNPSSVSIEGLRHLIYHGTSMDSMIANLPGASYHHPEKVMIEYLKRRHLSPIYGGNLIIPENIDYMVIDDSPDIFHSGHVHKNGYAQYRGTLIINSGTFQDRTDFQVKQGHVPTPALVPVYEMKSKKLRTLDFTIS